MATRFNFSKVWGVWLLSLAVILVTFNVAMDPYLVLGVTRFPAINARKPSVYAHEALMKAYDVIRASPRTVILGASRVDFGLDAQNPAWPSETRPVYNLGIRGASPYMAYQYLRHVTQHQTLTLVVVALDFEYFLTGAEPRVPTDPAFGRRLAISRTGGDRIPQNQYLRDVLLTMFSLDSLTDSASTFRANFGSTSWNIVSGNVEADASSSKGVFGSYALFSWNDLYAIQHYSEKQIDPQAMADIRAILDLCRSNGTHVILFIDPTHADMLEIYDLLGYWGDFENWKRDLMILTTSYAIRDTDQIIPLWDFSGYDTYSTEQVEPDHLAGRWFRESFHYTRPLGDKVVRDIFGNGVQPEIGVLLTPQTIEAHLRAIRETQRQYRVEHPLDAQRVRSLRDAVIKQSSTAP